MHKTIILFECETLPLILKVHIQGVENNWT